MRRARRIAPAFAAVTAESAVVLGGLVAVAPTASAKDGDMKTRGTCSSTPNASQYAAKVKARKGAQRADFWIKNNTVGQSWTLTVTQDGQPVGTPITKVTRATDDGPSSDDSLHTTEVKWRTWLTGTGPITFSATAAGETCTVTVP